MTVENIILTVISTVVTAVIIPLITMAGNKLIAWLGAKTHNEKAATYMATATTIVLNAVKTILQTYVDSLKKSGSFNAEAQQEAKKRCREIVLTQITPEVKEYIQSTFGNFDSWLDTQIEANVKNLKNAEAEQ